MLERIYRCRAVIFDKTGTLTYGKPALSDICAARLHCSEKRLEAGPGSGELAMSKTSAGRGSDPSRAERRISANSSGLRKSANGPVKAIRRIIDGAETSKSLGGNNCGKKTRSAWDPPCL